MVIQLNKVPNSLFCKVTKVRDIRQASFIDKSNVKRGGPDIVLASPLGYANKITRKELMDKYCTHDGKRIKMYQWRYGRKYIVMANESTSMYALKVPNNSKVKIIMPNNNEAGTGVYLLCTAGNNGEIAKNNAIKIKENLFNRMFRIDSKPTKQVQMIKQIIKNRGGNENSNCSNKRETQSVKKLVVVKRIVRPDNGKMVGFVVSNGKVAKNLNLGQVMDMCRLKQIQNVTIVDDSGKEYLRGVGIRLMDLPSTYI